jgi:hypothetical protein
MNESFRSFLDRHVKKLFFTKFATFVNNTFDKLSPIPELALFSLSTA